MSKKNRLRRQHEEGCKVCRPRFVKINKSRGYGDGMFKVLASRGLGTSIELQLQNEEHGKFWIYEAHTYKDIECAREAIQAAKAVSNFN